MVWRRRRKGVVLKRTFVFRIRRKVWDEKIVRLLTKSRIEDKDWDYYYAAEDLIKLKDPKAKIVPAYAMYIADPEDALSYCIVKFARYHKLSPTKLKKVVRQLMRRCR